MNHRKTIRISVYLDRVCSFLSLAVISHTLSESFFSLLFYSLTSLPSFLLPAPSYYSPELSSLIRAMLEKDPSKRITLPDIISCATTRLQSITEGARIFESNARLRRPDLHPPPPASTTASLSKGNALSLPLAHPPPSSTPPDALASQVYGISYSRPGTVYPVSVHLQSNYQQYGMPSVFGNVTSSLQSSIATSFSSSRFFSSSSSSSATAPEAARGEDEEETGESLGGINIQAPDATETLLSSHVKQSIHQSSLSISRIYSSTSQHKKLLDVFNPDATQTLYQQDQTNTAAIQYHSLDAPTSSSLTASPSTTSHPTFLLIPGFGQSKLCSFPLLHPLLHPLLLPLHFLLSNSVST